MVKKILLVLMCLTSLVIFVFTLHGQSPIKAITLPSGEVINDLNGEWDYYYEHYGRWSQYGSGRRIVMITQTGSSVVHRRGEAWGPFEKGSVSMQGELNKNGFKKVQLNSSEGFLDCKGQISEDGNKMEIDDGEKLRVTYTRK